MYEQGDDQCEDGRESSFGQCPGKGFLLRFKFNRFIKV